MKHLALRVCFISASIAANLAAAEATSPHETATSWDAKAAAGYLDGRITWWMNWPTAARDHGTFCVSCHTAVTYAVGRPALRASLAETAPSTVEQQLLDNVTKRVRMWAEVEPFYPDKLRGVPKTIESRGTESILNALILVRYGTPDAKLALDHMWAEQLKDGDAKGAWNWLQFQCSLGRRFAVLRSHAGRRGGRFRARKLSRDARRAESHPGSSRIPGEEPGQADIDGSRHSALGFDETSRSARVCRSEVSDP